MEPESFVEDLEVDPLMAGLQKFAMRVATANERQAVLSVAGIEPSTMSTLRWDVEPFSFAQQLVSLFKSYQVSRQRPDYHPMVRLLDYLGKWPENYGLSDEDIELFTKLVERGKANLQLLTMSARQPSILSDISVDSTAAGIAALSIGKSPYRGLSTFREEDRTIFFGRDTFIDDLEVAIQKQPLVAVIGASGSGKSSVVYAGLIPRLRDQGEWVIIYFHAGDRPLHALATALVPVWVPEKSGSDQRNEIDKLTERLRQKDHELQDIVEQVLQKKSTTHFLLFADQFEELYTLCDKQEERQLFLDQLLQTNQSASGQFPQRFNLVLTLRADFLTNALSYRPFADALQHADLKLGPMTRQELELVIRKPAENSNVRIEGGLTERILNAVSQEPGNLPLLEFALTELWSKQRDGKLTHDAYDEIGGVEKALADYAEKKVYANLSPEDQKLAQRVFVQLVTPNEFTEDTRRIATRAELKEDGWALIRRLSYTRLVVTNATLDRKETAEIVHEALIQNWTHLQNWMKENRAFRAWQEHLRARLREWEQSKRDKGVLLRGAPLTEAKRWFAEQGKELNDEERDFLFYSILDEDIEIKNWINLYGTVEKTLCFLEPYISSKNEKERLRSIEALRWLGTGNKEEVIYERLQAFVYNDETSKVRQKAAQALYELDQLSLLVAQLSQRNLPKKKKRLLIQALASICNLPEARNKVKPALHKYKQRVLLTAIGQIVANYRTQFALVIAFSFALLQISYLILSEISNLTMKFLNLTITYSYSFGFLDIITTIAVGMFFIIRDKTIDKKSITLKKCFLIGIVSSLIANSLVMIGALITAVILLHSAQSFQSTPPSSQISDPDTLLYYVYLPLYGVLSSLIGMAIFASFLRINFSNRRNTWKLFNISLMSSTFAILLPFLIGFILQYFVFFRLFHFFPRLILLFSSLNQFYYSLLNQPGQTFLNFTNVFVFDVIAIFSALLGLRFGLRLTLLDEVGLEQSGLTTPVSISSSQLTLPFIPELTNFSKHRSLPTKSRALLVTLIFLIVGGSVGFLFSPLGNRINLALTGATLWTTTTGGFVRSSPVVVNGVVYVGSDDHKLYALSASTGAILWKATTGGFIHSSPVVVNGIVYVSPESGDINLYAFNATTGATVWTVSTGHFGSSPVVANGIVYIGSSDGSLYALNARTGTILWKDSTIGLFSSPVVANGIIYVGTDTSKLYALNARTGTTLWMTSFDGYILQPPVVANNKVYVSLDTGYLYAFNSISGKKLWTSSSFLYSRFLPVVTNDLIFITDGKDLHAIDAMTGKTLWLASSKDDIALAPVVANGDVYASSYNSQIQAFDVHTGKLVWSTFIGYYFSPSSLVVSNDDLVYVGMNYPNLYALNAKTSDVIWVGSTGNAISTSSAKSLALVVNGVIYIGSDDSKVYAFQLPSIT